MTTKEKKVWVRTITVKGVLTDVCVYENDAIVDAEKDALVSMGVHHKHVHMVKTHSYDYRRFSRRDSILYHCTTESHHTDGDDSCGYIISLKKYDVNVSRDPYTMEIMDGVEISEDLAEVASNLAIQYASEND